MLVFRWRHSHFERNDSSKLPVSGCSFASAFRHPLFARFPSFCLPRRPRNGQPGSLRPPLRALRQGLVACLRIDLRGFCPVAEKGSYSWSQDMDVGARCQISVVRGWFVFTFFWGCFLLLSMRGRCVDWCDFVVVLGWNWFRGSFKPGLERI